MLSVAAMALSGANARLAVAVGKGETIDYDGGHIYLIRPDAYIAPSVAIGNLEFVLPALAELVAAR